MLLPPVVKHIQEPETSFLLQQVLESCRQAQDSSSTNLDAEDLGKVDDGMQVEYALATLLNECMEWPELQAEIESVDELAFQIKCICLASLLPVVRTIQARVQRYVVAKKSEMNRSNQSIAPMNDSCDRTEKFEMNVSVCSSLHQEASPPDLSCHSGKVVVVPNDCSEIKVSVSRRKSKATKKTEKSRAAKKEKVSDQRDRNFEDVPCIKTGTIDISCKGKRKKDVTPLTTKQVAIGSLESVGSRVKCRKKKPSRGVSKSDESFCEKVSDHGLLEALEMVP